LAKRGRRGRGLRGDGLLDVVGHHVDHLKRADIEVAGLLPTSRNETANLWKRSSVTSGPTVALQTGLWRGEIPPTDSRWDDAPQGYVRQEYTVYLSHTTTRRYGGALTGQVRSVHMIEVSAHHILPAQLRRHPCGQGRHRHDYRIRIEALAPADVLTDDAAMRLRTAAAALQRAEEPLHGKDLDRLGGGTGAGTDDRWLAGWVHQ
jgi:hypothetical protein